LPLKVPSIGAPPGRAGRFDTKTRKEPSGAIAGSMSLHSPENEAIVGVDQPAAVRSATTIVDAAGLERVK